MAELTARQDSFISLLIEVSGRARPGDLMGLTTGDAKAVLQAYLVAHPDRGLHFDGEMVVPVPADMPTEKVPAVISEPEPEPESVAVAAAPVAPVEEWGAPAPVAPVNTWSVPAPEPAPLETPMPPIDELPAWAMEEASLGADTVSPGYAEIEPEGVAPDFGSDPDLSPEYVEPFSSMPEMPEMPAQPASVAVGAPAAPGDAEPGLLSEDSVPVFEMPPMSIGDKAGAWLKHLKPGSKE